MKVKEAAEKLNTTPNMLRAMMRAGAIDIGYIVKHDRRNVYIINESKLKKEAEGTR